MVVVLVTVTVGAVGGLLWELCRWADRYDTQVARLEESDRKWAKRHRI